MSSILSEVLFTSSFSFRKNCYHGLPYMHYLQEHAFIVLDTVANFSAPILSFNTSVSDIPTVLASTIWPVTNCINTGYPASNRIIIAHMPQISSLTSRYTKCIQKGTSSVNCDNCTRLVRHVGAFFIRLICKIINIETISSCRLFVNCGCLWSFPICIIYIQICIFYIILLSSSSYSPYVLSLNNRYGSLPFPLAFGPTR